MPKITEAAGGSINTWRDGVAFPGFDTSNPAARDVYATLQTIRTAAAVFEGKEIRWPFVTPAAAGSDQSDATPITGNHANVTGADGAKGVTLPAATAGDEVVVLNVDTTSLLKVYPVYGGAAAINGLAANLAFIMMPGERCVFFAESAALWRCSGLRVARGQATTAAASDTIVTGLNFIHSVVASLDDDPVDGCMHASASKGDQAGAPAAGSFLLKTWKSTDADATLIAATTFSKKVNWQAVGY